MTSRFTAAIAVVLLAGCQCGPTNPPKDAGPEDAGFDAGMDVAAGPEDAGCDAGAIDAGPPPMLRIKKVLPPRGGAAGGTNVLLEGAGTDHEHYHVEYDPR